MRILIILLMAIVLNRCGDSRHPFEIFQEELKNQPLKQRQELLEKYIDQNEWPFAMNGEVYFLVKDSTDSAAYLTGDMCGWKKDSLSMPSIEGTQYKTLKMDFPPDARVEYKYVLGNQYILDPLNPYLGEGGYGKNSALMMPEYKFPTEILIRKQTLRGKIDTLHIKSRILKNERNVYIYRNALTTKSSPVLIFNDGSDYLTYGSAGIILDNLIADKSIPPLWGIFIDPVGREKEYWMDDRYLQSVFKEIMPQFKKRYQLDKNSFLGMGGASLGGLISLYALKNYESKLDYVFAQSPSLWPEQNRILSEMDKPKTIHSKVYFDRGNFENSKDLHQKLIMKLKEKNVVFKQKVFNEGHNWANWRAHLPQLLTFGLKGMENER